MALMENNKATSPLEEQLRTLRVMVVDDSVSMRKLIRIILESIDVAEIYEADDGTTALRKMIDNPVDVIITDWRMTPMDGIELTQKIRSNPEPAAIPPANIPIIMVSAHTDRDLVLAARDAGVNEMLTKPVSAKMLRSRFLSILERPRDFVRTGDYAGPDRRRRQLPEFDGPDKRTVAAAVKESS